MTNGIKILLLTFLLTVPYITRATHNRAGELIYNHIQGYEYEFTITTYTYSESPAIRDMLEIKVSDEGTVMAYRSPDNPNGIRIPGTTYIWNTYTARYTFSGPGTYEIIVEDPNRNLGVKNIPNSVNIPFSIKTVMLVNAELGANDAPELLSPPIHKAAQDRIFIHIPVTYDKQGDSLTYAFTACTGERGEPISNYVLPASSNYFRIDPVTGEMVWNTPVDTGVFNVAIEVKEWRNGIAIGKITRDMQIEVFKTDNYPPDIEDLGDNCIYVDNTFQIDIDIVDNEKDNIKCSAQGGPFQFSNSPEFEQIQSVPGFAQYSFSWKPGCKDVRSKPYEFAIVAEDDNKEIKLADAELFTVKVMGPPPVNLETRPQSNLIQVAWDTNYCQNVSYVVYRSTDSIGYEPDTCFDGVNAKGYEYIGITNDVIFTDNNNGNGLTQGYKYCYIVAAKYENGTLSYPSQEICTYLIPPVPNIINTSVQTIDSINGSVFISWLKPNGLTDEGFNGPYKYKIYRSTNLWGNDAILIDSIATADLNDTTYLDTLINTLQFPYTYIVELYNEEPGNYGLVAENPGVSSTLYSKVIASDNKLTLRFTKNVPWVNEKYDVYRFNKGNKELVYLGYSDSEEFTDSNLTNNIEYCYRVLSTGKYIDDNENLDTTTNWSHINCGIPIDTVPPCPPILTVLQNCDSITNELSWLYPATCDPEVVKYKIYFKNNINSSYDSLVSLNGFTKEYIHNLEISNAGCYYVTAIDSSGNESAPSNVSCIDICLNYELPNVFTPNNDEINDIFIPTTVDRTIEKVDMKIFNRWGQLVFQTSDPLIRWKGLHQETKKVVPSGVYYYICDVYAAGIMGVEPYNIIGFIHVYSDEKAIIRSE